VIEDKRPPGGGMQQKKTFKLISWNVNGLRAVMQKDFLGSFSKLDADLKRRIHWTP
jgi:hypothetical protein